MTRDIHHDSPHDDLPLDHGADAANADALDARLNEIAHSPRRATAWPGFGPKRRSQVRDTTGDLPDFAQAFHQRVERADVAEGGSRALDPTLWEQIMASTRATTGATTASPGPITPSTALSGGKRPVTRSRPGGSFWTGFANATLAVVLLLTAFGAWRVYDRGQGSPPPSPEITHNLAFQPETSATPEMMVVPPVATSTPDPAFACDFTRDIPILLEVDTSPLDATVVLLTSSGDVVLSCPQEPEPVVLTTNMGQVAPTEWPGVMMTMALNYQVGVSPVTYLNLFTGEQVEIVPTFRQPFTMGWTGGHSQWAVQDSGTDVSGDVTLVDLRTFDSRLLSDLYLPFAYPEHMATIASTNGSGVLAVALSTRTDPETGIGALFPGASGPGAVLIIDGSLSHTRWIRVPDDLTDIQEMVLSPDGDFLALRSTSGTDGSAASMTSRFSVIRTDTGEEVGRSNVSHALPEMRWAMDGDALVFIDDTGLSFLQTRTGEIGRLLETSDELQDLRSTSDPATVLATAFQIEDLTKEPPMLVNHRVLSLNVQTGEMVTIDGINISQNISPWYPDTRILVMAEERLVGAGPHTFRVVDAVSGQDIGALEEVEYAAVSPQGQPTLDMRQVVTTPNGATVVISFGPQHTYLLHQGNGVKIDHLPPPDMEIAMALGLTLSPDGQWLSATPLGRDENQLRYVLDLTDPDAEWQPVSDDVRETGVRNIFFVQGTGD